VACWDTKAAISLKRVKTEEKLLCTVGPIGTHQSSFERYHSRPPLRPPLPQDWSSQPTPKTPIVIMSAFQEGLQIWGHIHSVHPNKSSLKFLEKRECGRIQGLPKIFGYPPIILGIGKAMNFKFGRNIHRVHPNKSPLKILEKRERGHISRDSQTFWVPLIISKNDANDVLMYCT